MEGRMTICNMSIEMRSPRRLIAPDMTTFEYLSKVVQEDLKPDFDSL